MEFERLYQGRDRQITNSGAVGALVLKVLYQINAHTVKDMTNTAIRLTVLYICTVNTAYWMIDETLTLFLNNGLKVLDSVIKSNSNHGYYFLLEIIPQLGNHNRYLFPDID